MIGPISNGSGCYRVDRQTHRQSDKQTKSQTDTTENNTTLAARVVNMNVVHERSAQLVDVLSFDSVCHSVCPQFL